MSETIKLIITKFTDETITITTSLLFMTLSILIAYWLYNRKKFRELQHEIPAHVVKNYLDSIIQNSNALKSSLFRGGGLDIGSGIPSVMPVSELPSSNSLAMNEEIHSKNAEISALTSKLSDRNKQISELEKKLASASSAGSSSSNKGSGAEVDALRKEIANLQAELKNKSSGGGDAEHQLQSVIIERDELKERLKEYEIIEEDLANLKKFQQENEQFKIEIAELKKKLSSGSGPGPAAPQVEEEPIDLEAEMAKAIVDSRIKPAPVAIQEEPAVAAPEAEQKSADELLSEFEKMLG